MKNPEDGTVEPVQHDDEVKNDEGPLHIAPENPEYSSSFDESAGGPDSDVKRE
jgi:hypothetical protein